MKVFSAFSEEVKKLQGPDASQLKETLEKITGSLGIATGRILQALRLAITGGSGGPDLMVTMEIIGSDEIAGRITQALKTLKVKVA